MTLETILQEDMLARISRGISVARRDSMQDSLNWIPIILFFEDAQDINNGELMLVMSFLIDKQNEDYFFDFKDYRNLKLYSGMTKKPYDAQSDIDENDYLSLKKGYVNLERLLLRLKNVELPRGKDAPFTVDHMIRECLKKMASLLLYIIRNNSPYQNRDIDHTVRYEQELSFAAHVQATSTPDHLNASRKRKSPDISPIICNKRQKVEDTNRRLFEPELPRLT